MNFNLSIPQFINDILPVILRQPKNVATLKALLAGFKLLLAEFTGFRNNILKQMSITSESVILEYYLNEKFTGGSTDITIENVVTVSPALFCGYLFEDGHSVFVGYNTEDIATATNVGYLEEQGFSEVNFIVHVPANFLLTPDNPTGIDKGAIDAFLRQYIFAGKKYVILENPI
jgi:hypothetical protein